MAAAQYGTITARSRTCSIAAKNTTLPLEQWETEIIAPVCAIIARQMKEQGISTQEESYMQVHAEAAAQQAALLEQKEVLVEKIVRLEFSEFDKVKTKAFGQVVRTTGKPFRLCEKVSISPGNCLCWNNIGLNCRMPVSVVGIC